jgi:hypothetical protein
VFVQTFSLFFEFNGVIKEEIKMNMEEMNMNDMKMNDVVTIGANCVVNIGKRFFLLVEIEVEILDLEEFVFIEISEREFRRLQRAGVELCTVTNRRPTENAEFKCVLIVDGEAFAVFDVENNVDEAVLVSISLARAAELIRRGAMKCTVINRQCNS